MAPEVALQHKYTKSVDIWAIGIIMHIVISGGKHPFYESGDDPDVFLQKLKTLKKVDTHPSLSKLAVQLFMRLTAV